MKAAKWRDLSEDELTQKARELSEEIFNLRFQLSMGVAKNPSRLGQARRDLARAYTISRERGAALVVAAPPAEKPAAKAEAPERRERKAAAKASKPKAAKASKAAGKSSKAPKAAAKKKAKG
jgi:large subunit ribosomal protein L29